MVVFGLVLDRVIEFTLVREFDFYLQTLAKTLAAAAESEGKHVTVKLVPESLSDLAQVEGELFSQYWNADGGLLAKNLGGHELPPPSPEAGRSDVLPFVLWDGRGARAAHLRFRTNPNPRSAAETPPGSSESESSLTLAVARDTTDLESHIRQLRGLLLAAGVATLGVGAIVSVVVIRRSLRPLGEVAAGIAAIGQDDLSTRLPATALLEEICCPAECMALGILVANLLENAVQYADEHGRIWVTARGADGDAELVVANSGCTLTDEQVARVFDRFWRSDAARKETSLHVGLGLSLVRRIAESWGGTATATVDGRGTFRVRVAWPCRC
jgi:hypothetical protein